MSQPMFPVEIDGILVLYTIAYNKLEKAMQDAYEDCVVAARAELARARQLLNDEITGYPTPIAGCDAQFNCLLADRQKILAAIKSLDDAVFVPTPRSPMPSSGVESR